MAEGNMIVTSRTQPQEEILPQNKKDVGKKVNTKRNDMNLHYRKTMQGSILPQLLQPDIKTCHLKYK